MKNFINVLRFELSGYFKSKAYIGVTLALVIIVSAVLSFPRLSALFEDGSAPEPGPSEESVVRLAFVGSEKVKKLLSDMLPSFEIIAEATPDTALEGIESGEYAAALEETSESGYRYITKGLSITDTLSGTVRSALFESLRLAALVDTGLSAEEAAGILFKQVDFEVVSVGKNQIDSFLYTYILVFMLYMAILLYGQFVASSVANEKSSRAMELLVTSAKPSSLIFGKVIATGFSGLFQIAVVLSASFLMYNLNRHLWEGNPVIDMVFAMPLSTMLYALLFFVCGFFVYSFMYGAFASLASRLEEINVLILPVTFMFIAAFMIVMFSMIGGTVDSTLMRICSFVPFTSPMAMFARITMGEVAGYEIILSIGILVATVFMLGYLAALIYRAGVLMYGKPPKLSQLFKLLKTGRRIKTKG